jgi:D-amino-acid dehydrogenase
MIGVDQVNGVVLTGTLGPGDRHTGPVTGRLLADQTTTGKQPGALSEPDPLPESDANTSR